MKTSFALALIATTVVAACAAPPNERAGDFNECAIVDALRIDRAELDANEAMSANDYRLLAIYGYSFEFPGSYELYAPSPSQFRAIECTGDNDTSGKEGHTEKAVEYARRYNTVLLRRLLSTTPEAMTAGGRSFGRGWQHMQEKQHELAIAEFARASELVPKAPEPFAWTGRMHREMGRSDLALQDFARAIEANPDYPYYVTERADILSAMGNTDQALEELGRAIARYPSSYDYFFARSKVFEAAGDIDRTLDDLHEAIERGPGRSFLLEESCRVRAIHNRELETALSECGEALQQGWSSALSWQAFVKFRQGRLRDAIEDYDTWLEDAPRHPPSLFVRGIAKRRVGLQAEGDADIALATRLDSDVARTFARYGIEP